jgi:hypothetical protein
VGDSVVHKVLLIQRDALQRGVLNIWTIYARPVDHPNHFVARRFEVGGGQGEHPTSDLLKGELHNLRECFRRCGLTRMAREEGDDDKIVESWL